MNRGYIHGGFVSTTTGSDLFLPLDSSNTAISVVSSGGAGPTDLNAVYSMIVPFSGVVERIILRLNQLQEIQ